MEEQNIQNRENSIKNFLDQMTERGELPGIQYLVLDKNKILN